MARKAKLPTARTVEALRHHREVGPDRLEVVPEDLGQSALLRLPQVLGSLEQEPAGVGMVWEVVREEFAPYQRVRGY